MAELGKSEVQVTEPLGRVAAPQIAVPSPSLRCWHKPVFIACLGCWLANLVLIFLRIDSSPLGGWLEEWFLVLATASTLLALGRRLPLQNVIATAAVIILISSAVISLAALSGIPLGPVHYTISLGQKILNVLPWPIPLGWIFLIVNGRGVARLIMRPW